MPHDPARIADTRAWLGRTANDVRGAEIDLAADPRLLEDALSHCQQAVEKSLKAFLTWHDRPFRKTHSIEEIGEECLRIDGSLRALIDRAVPLSEYAWLFRYPGASAMPTRQEAESSLALAREIVAAVRTRLPCEVDPRE